MPSLLTSRVIYQSYSQYLRYMKTNDAAFGHVYLSSYLPLKYPTHFLSLRSDNYAEINEMDPHFLHIFLLKILLSI